jgi:hypothetical protein
MSFGEFLWTLLIFYFIFFYFIILFRILADLFSNHALSGWAKAGWIIFLLILPFISMIVYLTTQAQGMTERAMAQAKAANEAEQSYIRQVAGSGADPAAQIAKAHDLLNSGAITQAEFDAIKAKALA